MKKIRHLLAILMTVTMIVSGGGLDGFAAFSYAANEQDAPAVSQEEETPAESAEDPDENASEAKAPEETADKDSADAVKDESVKSESSDSKAETKSEAKSEDSAENKRHELHTGFKLSDESSWKVTAVYDDKAGIPEEAKLNIEEVKPSNQDAYLKEVPIALKWDGDAEVSYARFLAVSITSKGKTVQPAAEVEITITANDVSKDDLKAMQVVRFDDQSSAKAKELKCEVTKDGEVVFRTDEFADFGFVVSKDSMDAAEGEDENAEEDSDLVHKTLKADNVRLEGLMPEDAKATAADASDSKAVKSIESEDGTALAAYDIEIKAEGEEYQPDADHPITVQISNTAIKEDSDLSVWHIGDDGKKEEIKDFTVSNGKVSFEATGFSVYVVIDHEEDTVVTPRVQFHFIDPDATEHGSGSDIYYEASPYPFRNKAEDADQNTQTTQILKDGESLEMIVDPSNRDGKAFLGWYVVDPYTGSGSSDPDKLYYTWPSDPDKITFESPISIEESDVAIGTTVNWSLHGVSGSGEVDKDGNVHAYLAPLYDNYNFVNFMLRPRTSDANSIMARKLVARGSSSSLEVKISDIRSNSNDAVHLIFTGWEYNAGTAENPDWQQYQTVDYSGEEMKDPGRDGVYFSAADLEDKQSIDLYPHFVQARWVDFVPGISGSGASYVNSRFLEAHGAVTPEPAKDKSYFATLDQSTRKGYNFDGWYAFAVLDSQTGEITNLEEPAEIEVNYIDLTDYSTHKVKVNTTAVKVADSDGSVSNCGTYSVTDNGDGTGTLNNDGSGNKLFEASGDRLIFFDSLDRLQLFAKWAPDESKLTIVYWTEKAQDKDTVVSDEEKDNYSASAVKTISTSVLGPDYQSGSTVTRDNLQDYQEGSVSILDRQYLGTVGAVPEDEAKFYDLNTDLSDAQVVISGDGNTVFNVYYERMTFHIVFHIGRDGYVKNGGHQKTDDHWDGNWIEFMYKDPKVTALGYPDPEGTGRNPSNSYQGLYKMTYLPEGKTYTSEYVTNNANVMGDYLPSDDENVYVITAKYGAYIGDRWPTPTNPNFEFTDPANRTKTMYIWAAYYGSLYCRIANERSTAGNPQGANPDINGVYSYMSAELCSNRAGTGIINANKVHHLVAYYGEKSNQKRYKQYHILFEAMDGTYDPAQVTPVPGTDYENHPLTTWSQENTAGDKSEIIGHEFIELPEESPKPIISNLEPQFQLSESLDGYDLVYSCYDPNQHANPDTGHNDYHIYFFYRPKQYNLTFMYEDEADRKTDTYYYKQSLADAKKYDDPEKEGHEFRGWYTNEAGIGEPFDFANQKMPDANVVLYPVLRVNQYTVRIDPNGGVIDHRANPAMSTYFTANYGTPIGEYSVSREYVKLSAKELDPADPLYYTGDKYYYINTQFIGQEQGGPDGKWGYPQDLRNAVYVSEDNFDAYYDYYCDIVDNADKSYWEGIVKLSKEDFIDTYTDYPYRSVTSEHYTFMGWYKVHEDGSVDSMPYNFNDPVKEPVTLQAKWRLDGGYYVSYNPDFYAEDDQGQVVKIVGELDQWTDPADPQSRLYADQTDTHVLRAPTDTNNPDWVFRGWRVVRANGTKTYTDPDSGETKEYTVWEPIQLDDSGEPVYYQPGDKFTIDSSLVSGQDSFGGIINMQAYYEPEDKTYRKPKITNLILDSNDEYGGYVNTTDSGSLPPLPGPGSSAINDDTATWYQGHPTQILLGDIQSNLALHLYRYATEEEYSGVEGKNFFTNSDGYLLLGFDENKDPESPKTGEAYVPTYASDSVASITRDDHKTLYAMWEPMVYATFVNTTDKPITVVLSGSGTDTVRIVNQVTGEFDRQQTTNTITIPAKSGDKNGEVKVVFPKAKAGTDSITAEATNDHIGKKMTVSGKYHDTVPYGTGSSGIPYSDTVTYTGTLQQDKDGIIVTYSEIPDRKVFYDVNDGTWTEGSADYVHLDGDLYSIDEDKIVDNDYKPADPTRSGKVFLGWTLNADIAAHTDFSSEEAVTWGDTTITPDAGSNVLDKIKDEYLWDFSQDPPFDQILYAVWSDTVTVTFDMTYDGSKLHTWTGPETSSTQEPYVFYRSDPNSSSVTYTLAKGDQVPKPDDPTAHSDKPAWSFIKWLTSNNTTKSYRNTAKDPSNDNNLTRYAFDFSKHIKSNETVVTSWTELKQQHFTFTVENNVVGGNPDEEFEYTISVVDDLVYGKFTKGGSNMIGRPDPTWGSVTTKLKNNQEYTVHVTVTRMTSPWIAYGIEISVTDRDGIQIKDTQVVYCVGNSRLNYTSDYKYTLNVTQEAKTDYETTVAVEDMQPADSIKYELDEPYEFSFTSKELTSTGVPACVETFGGEPSNGYVADANDSLKIVFTNTAPPIVAPTGYGSYLWPLIWMLILGMFLWTAMTYMRRRRSLEAFAMEAATADNADDHMDVPAKVAVQETIEYEAFDWTRINI